MNLFSLLGVGFQTTPGNPLYAPAGGAGDMTVTSGAPASFDDLTLYGVSPALAEVPVPMRRGAPTRMTVPGRERGVEVEHVPIESLTYQEAIVSFAKRDPAAMRKGQLELAAAGFMGKNPQFVPEVFDDVTYNAWNEVLKSAARSGRPVDDLIAEAIEKNGGMEEALKKFNISDEGTKPDSIPLTHPDDIRMTAREVSRKTLGKGWSKQQLDNFVSAYQAQEAAARSAGAAGGQYTQQPSMEAAAESAARRSNPAAAGATDWVNAGNMIIEAFRVLGGGGGGETGGV